MTNYFPLWGFIILMVSTPGPANLLLMSAGAQRGFQRTLPFLSGLVMGKLALNVAMALGFMHGASRFAAITDNIGLDIRRLYGVSGIASVDTTAGQRAHEQRHGFSTRPGRSSAQPQDLDDDHAGVFAIRARLPNGDRAACGRAAEFFSLSSGFSLVVVSGGCRTWPDHHPQCVGASGTDLSHPRCDRLGSALVG